MTTQQILLTIGLMIGGYILGSIPFSFLVAKSRGIDLRTVGSGNVGGSNVWRNVGFGPFLIAVAGDLLKGTLPTYLAMTMQLPAYAVVLVGLAAILGHTFSLFLHFKGGKAVATSGGVLLAMSPLIVAIALAVWAIVFVTVRISSVASLSGALTAVIVATVAYAQGTLPLAYMAFVYIAVAVIFYLHRENIKKLSQGKENRFSKLF